LRWTRDNVGALPLASSRMVCATHLPSVKVANPIARGLHSSTIQLN